MDNDEFVLLLNNCKNSIERFIYYKMPNKYDAEDILQEVLITGYKSFDKLKSKEKFKSWMLSIAANKCNDYYRNRLKVLEIPIDNIYYYEKSYSRAGITVKDAVDDTLENLRDQDKKILTMHYIKGMDQKSIASMLNIPVGTVKSRLYTARQNFKEIYPYPPDMKGECIMKNSSFPQIMPEITITKSNLEEFEIKCEQDIGWFIIPRLGEESSFATYDFDNYPTMKKSSETTVKVIGKAIIHGVECVEIEEQEVGIDGSTYGFTMFERLTDTHLQTIAAIYYSNGIKKISTFLDDDFLSFWGFGENNCGEELLQKRKGTIECNEKGELSKEHIDTHNSDIVGRYLVKIGNKEYDTIRQIYFNSHNELVENYINTEGKVVLFRRFNRFDWRYKKGYDQLWTDMFPYSDRIILNGDIYVHWYNCLPIYVI
ncbi:RNA polymerase sigma factor (sigma-70 family) [Keratinibaculum paraultunense]|uniref:RNA polymerase sigma factor (Sigma-70 family) n=1 Tax=Keratinibaculum paraultunense TaxID=1278232 RepID=A0A4R3KVX7_9FIRM|nr:sigma-70 family RNA polymerase sigma factor [Keratinibaculum paraultunense]QQY79280.1 sigma-70 family RNA polymerase sigma factor [Keratinibaculum paraultunense]TCS89412.1 RNA polymerase sigma factor (sigma-70 family) [Keratinibaculum paraultunense]